MEGLIPMVFKAIKEKKKRSQYRCLSMGAADTGNIAHDFYAFRNTPPPMENTRGSGGFDERRSGHRRYGSTGGYGINGGYDFKYGYDDDHEVSDGNYKHHHHQQLKRFGSHRMFSCITGAT